LAANFFADQSHCHDLFFASREQIRLVGFKRGIFIKDARSFFLETLEFDSPARRIPKEDRKTKLKQHMHHFQFKLHFIETNTIKW
jgi:hypothetical protein